MARKIEGWADRNGQIYKTEAEADKADAREDIEQIVGNAITGYDASFDVNQLIADRAELIAALERFNG